MKNLKEIADAIVDAALDENLIKPDEIELLREIIMKRHRHQYQIEHEKKQKKGSSNGLNHLEGMSSSKSEIKHIQTHANCVLGLIFCFQVLVTSCRPNAKAAKWCLR